MSRFVPLAASFLLVACASPYTAELRRLDREYKNGRLSYKEYNSRRATYLTLELNHMKAKASQPKFWWVAPPPNMQQQRAYYHQPAYRPPPAYKITRDPFGGYDVTPQTGTLGFDPYAVPY